MKTKQNTSSGKRTIIAPSRIVLFIVILFWILGGQKSFAQGVGISEASITPDTWSILELRSNLRGFLAPRMTTAERTTLGSKPPTAGMLVYDTDTKSFWYYDGAWIAISGGSSVLGVANGGTGLSSITANNLLYGNGTSALSLLPPGGTTGAILMNNAAGAPGWSLLSGLPSTAGILPLANGGTGSSTLNFWTLTGNAGTTGTAGTNFIGTTDGQDLVFKANSTERARIESGSGDIKIGDATSGTIKATKELVLRQDGDEFGSSILRLRNRNTENGAIFETTDPSATLVDFIFKTSTAQRNIRFEARGAGVAKTGVPSFHIGGAVADIPTLSVGDNYAAIYNRFKIGDFGSPTALLQLAAGTATVGTAPLKFTSGPLLTAPEAGAIEFLTDKYYGTITTGGFRRTFAFLESPTFTNTVTTPTINLSATSNQLVLQSAGVTGTLTWTPTASNKTITFPDASGTVALVNAGANWLVGGNAPSGASILGTTDNSPLNIQSGSGAMNIGTDPTAKVITIGNTTGATAVNINSGSVGLNLNAGISQPTNINTLGSTGTVTIGGTVNQTIAIGDGAGIKTVTLGSSNSSSTTTIESGIGNLNIGVSNAARTITIGTGTAATSQTVNINNTSTAGIVNIGNGITTGGSLTFGGTNMTSSVTTINGGTGTGDNVSGTSGLLIQAQGAGTINIGNSSGSGAITVGSSNTTQTLNLGSGTGTSTVNIANGLAGNSVSIANGANSSAQTINIGAGASAANNTIKIGSGINTVGVTSVTIGSARRVKGNGVRIGSGRLTINKPLDPIMAGDADYSPTVTELLDAGIFGFNTNNNNRNLNLPSAQGSNGVVQALPGTPAVGDVFTFVMFDNGNNFRNVVINPGLGWTLVNNNPLRFDRTDTKTVTCRVTSVTPNFETISIY